MRWLLLLLAIAGFALAFTTKSPGLLGLGLIVGIGCAFGFLFSLAAARISQTAQPETMLIVDPEVSSLRSRMQKSKHLQTDIRRTPGDADHASDDQSR